MKLAKETVRHRLLLARLLPALQFGGARNISLKEEGQLCACITTYLSELAVNKNLMFMHIPNHRGSSIQACLKNKLIGMIPGAPDYIVIKDGKPFFIEAKAKNGRQSKEQKLFQEWAEHCCIPYHVVRSIEELKQAIGER